MASTTNNGWPKDPAITRVFVGGDANGCEFRAGDVAVTLKHFFDRFHREVESVRILNGYRSSAFNASLPGSVPSSNHVSGTAGDVNGDVHPNEAAHGNKAMASGFSAAQTNAIRRLLADFGCVKWGGDFGRGYRDYMHFELTPGSAGRVAQIAAAVREAEKPKPPIPPTPTPTPPAPKPPTEEDDDDMVNNFYRMIGTQHVWQDFGTARRGVTSERWLGMTRARNGIPFPVVDLSPFDLFWDTPIIGADPGEAYQEPGKIQVWVGVVEDGRFGRHWVDAPEYKAMRNPPISILKAEHEFWALPVVGPAPA